MIKYCQNVSLSCCCVKILFQNQCVSRFTLFLFSAMPEFIWVNSTCNVTCGMGYMTSQHNCTIKTDGSINQRETKVFPDHFCTGLKDNETRIHECDTGITCYGMYFTNGSFKKYVNRRGREGYPNLVKSIV